MADLLKKVGAIIEPTIGVQKPSAVTPSNGLSFGDALKQALDATNEEQVNSEKAMTDLATGEVKDLHQAAIAIGKAELSMKMMLEVRNKAISAYKEISKTQM
jgi:flagellar hook-basal body complex protein FliE